MNIKKNTLKIIMPLLIIIIVATFIFMSIFAVNPFAEFFTQISSRDVVMQDEVAPELEGITQWLNTDGKYLKLEDLRGKVVLLDFWTYACINCQRTLPFVVKWDEKYRDDGLVVIGVHTPEFRFEKKIDNVLEAMEEYDIKYPVAIDNKYKTWRAYANRFWPAKYLIDKSGNIVYMRFGEGAYEQTEAEIQRLLTE